MEPPLDPMMSGTLVPEQCSIPSQIGIGLRWIAAVGTVDIVRFARGRRNF